VKGAASEARPGKRRARGAHLQVLLALRKCRNVAHKLKAVLRVFFELLVRDPRRHFAPQNM
jgi:hypothetical protein